jgi:RNA polymerase sigma factor (sigma-70 family)
VITECEFADLVERIKDGDDDAMGRLMEESRDALQRIARSLLGSALRPQLDSVDLVQSVQLILWLGLKTGRFSLANSQALLALAKTLLRRKVSRYWRQAKQEVAGTVDCSLIDTVVDQPLIPAKQETDPSRASDFEDVVEFFLGQLGDLDRELVKLRFQGYSTADAARHLNLDPGYLRVRLGRLRTRFAEFREYLLQLSEKDNFTRAD